jgi:hypothetical protein
MRLSQLVSKDNQPSGAIVARENIFNRINRALQDVREDPNDLRNWGETAVEMFHRPNDG